MGRNVVVPLLVRAPVLIKLALMELPVPCKVRPVLLVKLVPVSLINCPTIVMPLTTLFITVPAVPMPKMLEKVPVPL